MTAARTTFAPRHLARPEPILVRHPDLEACQRAGSADQVAASEVLESLPSLEFWGQLNKWEQAERIQGTGIMLAWLAEFPGSGWQQRWVASGIEADSEWSARIATREAARGDLAFNTLRTRVLLGLGCLMLQRVVLPNYEFLCTFASPTIVSRVRQSRSPELFVRMQQFAETQGIRPHLVGHAMGSISTMLLHTGRDVEELSAGDIFEFRAQRPRAQDKSPKGLHVAWQMLAAVGVVLNTTLRAALRRGQRSTADIVDSYQLQCREVRDVIVRYLDERRPALDHSSFRALARQLAGLFWADLETQHPGISSLHLSEETATAWRQRMTVVSGRDGSVRPRKQCFDVLLRVRAFYLDMHEWALQDPSWAAWAVPSPVRKNHTIGQVKVQKQTTAEMHQRVRERLPHLPVLVDVAERHLAAQTALLKAATATVIGGILEHDNVNYIWVELKSRSKNPGPDRVYIRDAATGELTDVLRTEADAFWAWAIVEVLRHTGVRHEELLELTQLPLISYRLPATGEAIPLLQIVPSKATKNGYWWSAPSLPASSPAIPPPHSPTLPCSKTS